MTLPADITAALRDHVPGLDDPDPEVRAAATTSGVRLLQAWTATMAAARGEALLQLRDDAKLTYEQLADVADVGTYQAAQKLVREARARAA